MLTIIFEVTFNVHEILWSSQLFVYKTAFFLFFQLQFVYKAKTSVLTCLHNQFISSNPNIVTYIAWFICDTKIIEC